MGQKLKSNEIKLVPETSRMAWRRFGRRIKLRVNLLMQEAQRQTVLLGLLAAEGLASACRKAGITMADAIAERARNPQFRKAWIEADAARLEAAETLIIDRLMGGLQDEEEGKAPDKTTLGLWQALMDERRRQGAAVAKAPAVAAPAAGGMTKQQQVEKEDKEARELLEWLNQQVAKHEQKAKKGA